MAQVLLFLSTVSAEFKSYRERLRHLLDRPNVTVKVQEDFIVTGDETLEMQGSLEVMQSSVPELVLASPALPVTP